MPHGKVRLLSPQHWAQSKKGGSRRSANETTDAEKTVLRWGEKGEYKLTIPLDSLKNVATFNLAPGYDKYNLYCQEAQIIPTEYDQNPETLPVVSDDEEENTQSTPPSRSKSNYHESGHHPTLPKVAALNTGLMYCDSRNKRKQ